MSAVERQFWRLRAWIEARSISQQVVVFAATLAFLAEGPPLIVPAVDASGRIDFLAVAAELAVVLAGVTAYYVLYVCVRSFVAAFRRRRETPIQWLFRTGR